MPLVTFSKITSHQQTHFVNLKTINPYLFHYNTFFFNSLACNLLLAYFLDGDTSVRFRQF